MREVGIVVTDWVVLLLTRGRRLLSDSTRIARLSCCYRPLPHPRHRRKPPLGSCWSGGVWGMRDTPCRVFAVCECWVCGVGDAPHWIPKTSVDRFLSGTNLYH